MEIYSVIGLEGGSLRHSVGRAGSFQKLRPSLSQVYLLASGDCRQSVSFQGLSTHHAHLLGSSLGLLPVCVLSSCKDTSHWI